MEQEIIFDCDDIKLEGRLNLQSLEKGVVVTHPHPLYGGDMDNVVVELITQIFKSRGFTTLRFNFRGVGSSRGQYSDGAGEARDVYAAAEYLKTRKIRHLFAAGYSFGAWVIASPHCTGELFEKMILVSPPVAFMDFSPVHPIENLMLVITGSLDSIAPPDQVKDFVSSWNPSAAFEIVQGADHFFWNHFKTLDQIISSHI